MKKIIGVSSIMFMLASPVVAEDIKIGISLGFTGPLESLAPAMNNGAQMAIAEVAKSKSLLGGSNVVAVTGDSTCADTAAAVATGERLVTADNVNAIVGAMCSGPGGVWL